MTKLQRGLHERLLTTEVRAQIEEREREGWWIADRSIDDFDRPERLARHLYEVARRALTDITGSPEERRARQVAVTNQILDVLQVHARTHAAALDDAILPDASMLLEAQPPSPTPIARVATVRPHLALSESCLLVNGHHDYQVGLELGREVASADRIDLLCAFVRYAGLRLMLRELEAFRQRGGRLRVITTVYTGSTERRALDELVRLGAEVKVSYETSQTRLHAKAWHFHRDSGFHTAYIGSSNLTRSAMLDGLEWNVRVSGVDAPNIVERVSATFEQYWQAPEFAPYSPERDGERLERALRDERGADRDDAAARMLSLGLDLAPKAHQAQMLEALAAERLHGHTRNLVVAATGTGKTWVSAFDYKRLRATGHESLLFVAHRAEILQQSQDVFRLVLGDAAFGERYFDGERPSVGRHLFASVQSLHRVAESLAPDAFDVVIVDEFHHVEARTYQRLLDRLRPKVLVGLTATPERGDGADVLRWFGQRVACEVRLWQALDQGLLCPFHYFGIHDGTDLSSVTFARGRYAPRELEGVYTADDLRARRVLDAVRRYAPDPAHMRALGFCVGVAHARLMAKRFVAAGLAAVALDAESSSEERRDAIGRLRRGELRAIFTVDLFNEGVDIPEVDTIFMLRPTESPTVFLQQLGRGLRRTHGKSVLTVLDFIGDAHRKFRFDVRYRALVGGTRRQVESAIEHDFPLLPPGCAIRLEPDARQAILDNVRSALRNTRRALLEDLRELGPTTDLATFLRESDRELDEVYARSSGPGTFTGLRRELQFETRRATEHEPSLSKALGRLLHVDDDARLQHWRRWLKADRPPAPAPPDTLEGRLQLMLFAVIGHRKRSVAELGAAFEELWRAEPVREELTQVLALLSDRIRTVSAPLGHDPAVPIQSHATYGLYEIIAAYGLKGPRETLRETREGVVWAKDHRTDLLFVTLQKSDDDYSATTRYNDYPLSPTRFHWETQNAATADSPTGRRYQNHARDGGRVVLFVRERRKDERRESLPYVCLGSAQYVSHESERPMRITWELDRAMPAALFQEAKVAAG